MQETSERLLKTEGKGVPWKTSVPGKGGILPSTVFTSPFFVYAVICSIFLAFSIEIEEHLKLHLKSCTDYFREKFYMGKSLLQEFLLI